MTFFGIFCGNKLSRMTVFGIFHGNKLLRTALILVIYVVNIVPDLCEKWKRTEKELSLRTDLFPILPGPRGGGVIFAHGP